MMITIRQTIFGFHVAIVSDDRQRFAQDAEALKIIITKRTYRFNEVGRIGSLTKEQSSNCAIGHLKDLFP
jgi:hypothetical protein